MRSYNRFATDEEIACRIEGERDIATLYNLSCGGCMIESRNASLCEGAEIQVSLRDMATAQGRVVWRIEKHAGVKFETPVHQRIVELLGYAVAAESFDAEDPRDRFGLPLLG